MAQAQSLNPQRAKVHSVTWSHNSSSANATHKHVCMTLCNIWCVHPSADLPAQHTHLAAAHAGGTVATGDTAQRQSVAAALSSQHTNWAQHGT